MFKYFDAVQSQSSSVLDSLHALPVAVLDIPANGCDQGNHAQSAKHIVDCISHVFFPTCIHMY